MRYWNFDLTAYGSNVSSGNSDFCMRWMRSICASVSITSLPLLLSTTVLLCHYHGNHAHGTS